MPLTNPAPRAHPGVRSAFASYYTPAHLVVATTTVAVVADRIYYTPILIDGIVDRIGIDVTVGVAGSCRLGIYRGNRDGMPGALLVDAGTVSTAAVATVEASFTAMSLRGTVWLAAWFNAAPTVRCFSNTNGSGGVIGNDAMDGVPDRGLIVTSTFGTYANPATAPTGFSGTGGPAVFLRKS